MFRCLKRVACSRRRTNGDAAIQKFQERDSTWFNDSGQSSGLGGRLANFICAGRHLTILTCPGWRAATAAVFKELAVGQTVTQIIIQL